MKYPSILNDVIGPVMRGPSSSHCAASVRIGILARALMDGHIENAAVEFDETGSLAATHTSQGSDMGFSGGLLGYGPDDERLISYEKKLQDADIQIQYIIGKYGDAHPNTYRITLQNPDESHFMIALSTGGGMIEIIELDGIKLSMKGDCHETLIYFTGNKDKIVSILQNRSLEYRVFDAPLEKTAIIAVKSYAKLNQDLIHELSQLRDTVSIKQLPPVLPILTPAKMDIPFENAAQMIQYSQKHKLNLGDLAIEYESRRGNTGKKNILDRMVKLVNIMKHSIDTGIKGTRYKDRILHQQSDKFIANLKNETLLNLGMLNTIILYVTSLMEMKSAMGVIVAAPTAGSCGGLPGAIIGAADTLGIGIEETAKAMLAAGMAGVLIAKNSTFAAEECGCQAECGAGSGMAAAGLVTLMGGSCQTALSATSMALQNILGLVCDPVANRVEVPCLGRNIMAASNAVSCANTALAGFDDVIPLDEVILAMDDVGKKIHRSLRCTAKAGLSTTPSSKKIERKLNA